ncbi:xylosyltransferase oxt [Rhodnius prolixus]|uniref:xylosyltransferase oxt n=1 Tax=Rhodnius prolixus TaxID=13249 RepID=UPI003D18A0E5
MCNRKMAASKSMNIRWIRRYRLFWIGGCAILAIQIFIAYIFFTLNTNTDNPTQEYHLSGKGRLNVETMDDHIGIESAIATGRRNNRIDLYAVGDDEEEDSIGNSNAVYPKIKVPPDKSDHIRKGSKIDKVPKTAVSSANKTIHLRTEELDFTPMCEIHSKEAISAIHRARTQYCKQQIANTTCLINSGELYPKQLPHSCPAPGLTKGKALGCYQDDKVSRLLNGFYTNMKSTNSPTNCMNLCLQSGFPYAGVQYGSECFCGAVEPPSSAKLPDSSCNMKCPADPRQACGGFYTVNIYQTGVAKLIKEPVEESWSRRLDLKDSQTRVRIVFLLTLNGRAIRQVKRLIKSLFHVTHFFYIHVDARQDYLMRELLSLEMKFPNVRLSRRRHPTIWGGASLLTMLLEAMTHLVESDWDWDFIINLSESDLPLKTNEQLVEFLTANSDRNFVKSHGREVQRFIQKQGLDKTFVECDTHMWRTGDRTLPNGIVIDGGSDWLALSRPFVEYLATSTTDPLLQGLVSLFRHTLLPAESFFHTSLRNSPYCRSYVDNNLHVTNWRRRLGCKCQYKHIVDWCGCSPNNFRAEDWQRLQATENKPVFFARKFEPIIDQVVINQLDIWLHGSYPAGMAGVDSYWENAYHWEDLGRHQSDDGLISLANSLARRAVRMAYDQAGNCTLGDVKVLEVTTYHHKDQYKGSLILFESKVKNTEKAVKIESWVTPIDSFTILQHAPPASRIKNVFVSSDFDQKEQQSRNLLRVVGPFTELVGVFVLWPGETLYNVTVLWVDPRMSVVATGHLLMDDSPLVSFVKLNMKTPLLPGAWSLKLVWNSSVFAQTNFLVTPLEFFSGLPLTLRQAQFVHGGSGERFTNLDEEWSVIANAGARIDKDLLERKAYSNAKRTGKDLALVIDSLSQKFYDVVDNCIVSGIRTCGLMSLCQETVWSSVSPDPKSELRGINKTTGRIHRW